MPLYSETIELPEATILSRIPPALAYYSQVADPQYEHSLLYLLLTARHGGLVLRSADSMALLAMHYNRSGQHAIVAPIGGDQAACVAMSSAIQQGVRPVLVKHLRSELEARQFERAVALETPVRAQRTYPFASEDTYPQVTLRIGDMHVDRWNATEMPIGAAWASRREIIRRSRRQGLHTRATAESASLTDRDLAAAYEVIDRWQRSYHDRYSACQLLPVVEPVIATLSIAARHWSSLSCAASYVMLGNDVVGLSLITWTRGRVASGHILIADTRIPGASDLVMWASICQARSVGCHALHLGGSESKALFEFKKRWAGSPAAVGSLRKVWDAEVVHDAKAAAVA